VTQGLCRRWKARQVVRAKVAEVWRKMFDPNSGYNYYFNTKSGESR
jgi:hypothetical protein